eukprot:5426711-Lingulodinium_polyedra.AAC.1
MARGRPRLPRRPCSHTTLPTTTSPDKNTPIVPLEALSRTQNWPVCSANSARKLPALDTLIQHCAKEACLEE